MAADPAGSPDLLDGRTDSEAVRRKRNSSWLLSVAVRRRSELLVKCFLDDELFPECVAGWKVVLPDPASRDSLMHRNFNVSAAEADEVAVDFSAGADKLAGFDSGKSPDNQGVLYPAISAWDMDRYLSESAALCSAKAGGGRGSLNPWILRFLAATAAAGAKQLSDTDRLVRSTLRHLVESWLKSIGESGVPSTGPSSITTQFLELSIFSKSIILFAFLGTQKERTIVCVRLPFLVFWFFNWKNRRQGRLWCEQKITGTSEMVDRVHRHCVRIIIQQLSITSTDFFFFLWRTTCWSLDCVVEYERKLLFKH